MLSSIIDYHNATKHRLTGYAAGPGQLEWASQPVPFRLFHGTQQFQLPLQADRLATEVAVLHGEVTVTPWPLSATSLALLLELSLGLAAWKQWPGQDDSHRWALRCQPSSGNLHPMEAYLLLPHAQPATTAADAPMLAAGVYHYFSRDHLLSRRCFWQQGPAPTAIPTTLCFMGLSALSWRTAWKYGERAWRYVHLDAGHAMAAVRYAATLLGWSVTLLDSVDDESIERLLGINQNAAASQQDREIPVALLQIDSSGAPTPHQPEWLEQLLPGDWLGQGSRITRQSTVDWPLLEEA
ncbi:MAG: SagB/ThcOx family dehydrogenase, partial [Magnetococcales bacterium]|nr:SagB/ThcOx family dehydrogenase [Magnetococcales bacterium]